MKVASRYGKKSELKQNAILFNGGFLNVKRRDRKIADIKGGNCVIADVCVPTDDGNNMNTTHQWRV
jgi:hypothetical protein